MAFHSAVKERNMCTYGNDEKGEETKAAHMQEDEKKGEDTKAEIKNEVECLHTRTYDDEREGEEVCCLCGLVLTKLYQVPSPIDAADTLIPQSKIRRIPFTFIHDVCENAHMSKNIATHACNYFRKIRLEEQCKVFKSDALAAFAIYNALNELETPRTAEEVERYSGIPVKLLWQIAGCLTITNVKNNPTLFVDHFCSQLDLEYYDANIIRVIVGNMFGFGDVRPACLIAAVIRLYCLEKKRDISVRTICRACNISVTSVYRIIRMMDKKYVEKITLLYA